jgi:hypothetical protein
MPTRPWWPHASCCATRPTRTFAPAAGCGARHPVGHGPDARLHRGRDGLSGKAPGAVQGRMTMRTHYTFRHTPARRSPRPGPQSGRTMFAAIPPRKETMGMELVSCEPGRAVLRMTVRERHLNGHKICHGGFIFTLADSTFAFACNSHNKNARWRPAAASNFSSPASWATCSPARAWSRRSVWSPWHLRHESHQPARRGRGPVPWQERGSIQGNVIPRRPHETVSPGADREGQHRRVARLQLKRLKATLRHAYANSPVYRAKFDAAGVHPDD